MTLQDAIELIGHDITVWPLVGKGMSRDTEAELQPWKATLVGVNVTVDGARPVVQQAGYDPRELRSLESIDHR